MGFPLQILIVLTTLLCHLPPTESDRTPENRILGGRRADIGEFPMMVHLSILPDYTPACGGFIVNPNFIISAAHCFACRTLEICAKTTIMLVGDISRHRRKNSPDSRQIIDIKKIIPHKSFGRQHQCHDIALLKLETSIRFSENVQPASLAQSRPKVGQRCFVAGWGLEKEWHNMTATEMLMVTMITVQDSKICERNLTNFNEKWMICAGDLSGKRDACYGDSGGPMVCNGALAGIVSFGKGCGRPNSAAAYTDVSKYRKWIETEMRRNSARSTRLETEWTRYLLFSGIAESFLVSYGLVNSL